MIRELFLVLMARDILCEFLLAVYELGDKLCFEWACVFMSGFMKCIVLVSIFFDDAKRGKS